MKLLNRTVLVAFMTLAFTYIGFSQTLTAGNNAPAFSLRDVNGKVHNLNDFKDKFVVLEWINFDCPFVVKHYASNNMQKIQKEFTDKGVVWLTICSSAPGKQGHFESEEIKKRISELKANMNHYLIDEEGTVGKLYSARTTPHLFVINPSGNIIYQGAIDDTKSTNQDDIPKSVNYVTKALNEAMSGKSITTPTSQPYGCSVKYKD
jgi:glutathione peroxidase-family protein